MSTTIDRPQYRASGKVNYTRFLFWFVVVALPIALAAGFLLCKVFTWGFYLVMIAPLVAGLLAGAGVALAVRLGHCRNRWVGAVAGLVAGLVMYLGYYQFHLAHLIIGYQNVHRVDLLPGWIHFRILTDQQRKVGDVRDKNQAPGGNNLGVVDQVFKWMFFVFDCTAAVAPAVAIGWVMTTKPYSDRRRRWMTTHTTRLLPPLGDVILTGLADAGKTSFADQLRPAIIVPPEMAAQLTFDYLPDDAESPIYLTVAQVVQTAKNETTQRVLMSRVLLDEDEAKVIANAVNLPRTGEATRAMAPAAPLADQVSGRVIPLPEGEAGKAMTRGHNYRAVAIQLSPLILAVAVGAGLGWLAYANWDDWGVAACGTILALAVGVPIASLVYLVRYEHYLPGLYHHRRVMDVLRDRSESFVDPDDPDAVFVEVIPRANWSKMMAQNASDVGLLKVDQQRRAIVFEGDRERWIVPVESVLSYDVEQFTELGMEQNKYNLHSVVVLVANVEGRPWEAPLCPRNTAFKPWNADRRKELADDLHARLAGLIPTKEG